jgi:cation diffusion facilitator CzcD-associated flavoprotein CzcO
VTTTYPVEAIIFVLGYDALTGSLMRVDVRGKGGIQLSSEWLSTPAAYLGVAAAGFPNLFMITGPGSPSVLSIMTVAIEQHVAWMVELIEYLRREGYRSFEADREAQAAWSREVSRMAALTLYPQATSYYNGANIPGKPRVFVPYAGGLDVYSAKCEEIARQGYPGFRLA